MRPAPDAAVGTGVPRGATVSGATTPNPPAADASATPRRARTTLGRRRATAAAIDPALDEGDEFEPHPGWGTALAMTVRVLKSTLVANKDNLGRARALTNLGTAPTPLTVRIEKLRVPRRPDVVLDGMDPKDATGSMVAEWIDYYPPTRSSSTSSAVSAESASSSSSSVWASSTSVGASAPGAVRRVVLYIHGGAYFICSRKTHRSLTWRVSKHSRARVLAIDYRLAPEAVFPLALQDAVSAYLYLTQTCGYKPSEVVVYGDSAGGGLAFALLLWLRDHGAARGFGSPAAGCLLSPWMDLTHSMPSFRTNGRHDYLPYRAADPQYIHATRSHFYVSDDSQLTNPLVSPFFSREDPARPLPPLMVHAGGCERLRDEILHALLHNHPTARVQLELYEGMVHVFQMLATFLPVGELALRRMGAFTRECTNPGFVPERARRRFVLIELAGDNRERDLAPEDVEAILKQSRLALLAGSSGASSIAVSSSARPRADSLPASAAVA
ncbi:hypothetical protein HK405_004670 [Cladochytrium tenue]|nr:hypothetical protein HK405_004670 [Cladochytrium tenue]